MWLPLRAPAILRLCGMKALPLPRGTDGWLKGLLFVSEIYIEHGRRRIPPINCSYYLGENGSSSANIYCLLKQTQETNREVLQMWSRDSIQEEKVVPAL